MWALGFSLVCLAQRALAPAHVGMRVCVFVPPLAPTDELSPARGCALQKSLQQRGRVFVAFQDVRSACRMLCGVAGTNLLSIAQAASDLQAEPLSALQRMKVSRKQL